MVVLGALEIVAPLEFRESRGKVLRVVHVVEVIVRAHTVLRRHGDVGERGRGDGGRVTWVEAKARQIEALADLIAVIREALREVSVPKRLELSRRAPLLAPLSGPHPPHVEFQI